MVGITTPLIVSAIMPFLTPRTWTRFALTYALPSYPHDSPGMPSPRACAVVFPRRVAGAVDGLGDADLRIPRGHPAQPAEPHAQITAVLGVTNEARARGGPRAGVVHAD